MMKVKLTQLKSNHKRLRTKEVVGFTIELPKVGQSFCLANFESLTPENNARGVATSVVERITVPHNNGKIVFYTLNSVYELEILEKVV